MGSDLAMNPPRPPMHAALVSRGFGAVAIYRYPGEMESTSRVWHRVYHLPVSTPLSIKEAVATAAKLLDARVQEVQTDAVMLKEIHPDAMREILNPRPPTYQARHAHG